ncbi:MAG: hypothetical protein ACPGVN_06245 [Alphaproteobacteria bacterium]
MADLDVSKRRLDAALLRLDTLVRAAATNPAAAEGDAETDALIAENEGLREQLSQIQEDNAALKHSVDDMSSQLDTILEKLESVLEPDLEPDVENEDATTEN